MSNALEPVGRGVILRPDDGSSTNDDRFRKPVSVDDWYIVAVVKFFPDLVMKRATAGDDLANSGDHLFGSCGGFHK